MKWFLLSEEDLAKLDRVRLQLYREERLDGDRQRDLAHTLTGVKNALIPYDETQWPDHPASGG